MKPKSAMSRDDVRKATQVTVAACAVVVFGADHATRGRPLLRRVAQAVMPEVGYVIGFTTVTLVRLARRHKERAR